MSKNNKVSKFTLNTKKEAFSRVSYFIVTNIFCVLCYLAIMLLFSSCASKAPKLELRDVPVIKPVYGGGELICPLETKFVSGKTACLDEAYYYEEILPNSFIVPYETFYYFREFILKACSEFGDGESLCENRVKILNENLDKREEAFIPIIEAIKTPPAQGGNPQ